MAEKDELRIEYVPLDRAVGLLWRENPKLHDIQLLAESLQRHGMRDAPAFDAAIQEGGGIVDGNGRVETLAWMRGQGGEPPRGVLLDGDGAWCVPVQFGVDAESEAAAKAYALDANNIGYAGAPGATPWDLARMWDEEGYLALLEGLAGENELPVSVDGETIDLLLFGFDTESKNNAYQEIPEQYLIIIELKNEEEQRETLKRLSEEGYNCRALLS